MTEALIPTAELVGVHWVRTVDGVNADLVNTTLPAKSDDFEQYGFIQVTGVGGVPNPYNYMQNSVLQLDFWAYKQHSNRPPWAKANQLAMLVKRGVEDDARRLSLPGTYLDALVRTVIVRTDPRRIPDEAFARYSMDVVMAWTDIRLE